MASAVRRVAVGVLSGRSPSLSVLTEGLEHPSSTLSSSVLCPSDPFARRVNPDAKESAALKPTKKQSSFRSFTQPAPQKFVSHDQNSSSSYFHLASVHQHPSPLFSHQSQHQYAMSSNSTPSRRFSPLAPRFFSTLRGEEEAGELISLACRVVTASDPAEKLSLLSEGHRICESCLAQPSSLSAITPSNLQGACRYDAPGRPEKPELLHPTKMLTHKKLKVPLHVYLLHSLAHIELNAVDIACDMVARFSPGLPAAFACDWFEVAYEEGVHFQLLCDRLSALNFSYGDFPGHDGLWRAAESTKDDLVGRLVAIPLVQEARALDSKDRLNKKMISCADSESARLVAKICDEEIKHVKFGVKWLEYVAEERGLSAKTLYQEGVQKYTGKVVPPFNVEGRTEAGMPPDWYQSVSPPQN